MEHQQPSPVSVALHALVVLIMQVVCASNHAALRPPTHEPDAGLIGLLVALDERVPERLEAGEGLTSVGLSGHRVRPVVAVGHAVNVDGRQERHDLPITEVQILTNEAHELRVFLKEAFDPVLMVPAKENLAGRVRFSPLAVGVYRRLVNQTQAGVASLHIRSVAPPLKLELAPIPR